MAGPLSIAKFTDVGSSNEIGGFLGRKLDHWDIGRYQGRPGGQLTEQIQ